VFGNDGMISAKSVFNSANTVGEIVCPICDFAWISTNSSLMILLYLFWIAALGL
jgi:hypothetical protein